MVYGDEFSIIVGLSCNFTAFRGLELWKSGRGNCIVVLEKQVEDNK